MTLLADAQGWASDAFVWSSLALFVGFAILADAALRHGERHDGQDTHTADARGV